METQTIVKMLVVFKLINLFIDRRIKIPLLGGVQNRTLKFFFEKREESCFNNNKVYFKGN